MNDGRTSGNPITPLIRIFRRIFTPAVSVFIAIVAIVAIATADYIVLTSPLENTGRDEAVITLYLINGFAILIFILGLAWRVVRLLTARRQGLAGSQMHLRFVTLFGIFAVVPAAMMGIFSVITLNQGVDRYFESRIEVALDNAQTVAEAYTDSHKVNVVIETKSVLRELEMISQRAASEPSLVEEPDFLFNRLRELATEANFTGAYLMDEAGQVQIYAEKIERPVLPTADDLAQLPENQIVVRTVEDASQIQAIAKVPGFMGIYFLGVRSVNPEVIGAAKFTRGIVEEYNRMGQSVFTIKQTFLLTYLVVTALVMTIAMWIGFWLAQRLIDPVGKLVGVAEKITGGDLTARVDVSDNDDEMAILGRSFNRMTGQLQSQRNDLVEANRQFDERRRFTEAVLSGVSAGVVGLDTMGRVTIANRSAYTLLETRADALVGQLFVNVVPEMAELVKQSLDSAGPRKFVTQGQVDLIRSKHQHNFNVQVSNEGIAGEAQGLVITFDDITNLINAQRTSAWGDVARRIAHEIKNPLTPIQLSAERLKRKYSHEITTDPEVFEQCTETIVRQVGDIGRMVDEFSSFARMPTATLKSNDLGELAHQSVFMQQVANPQIEYVSSLPAQPLMLECDGRLLSQAFTNILKNAGEAISAQAMAQGKGYKGKINIELQEREDRIELAFEDNGCGLPSAHRHRLTEPYMTTRDKGTGLGLAIVKKIMEDHKGELLIEDVVARSDAPEEAPPAGARITMVFHREIEETADKSSAVDDTAPVAVITGV